MANARPKRSTTCLVVRTTRRTLVLTLHDGRGGRQARAWAVPMRGQGLSAFDGTLFDHPTGKIRPNETHLLQG